MGASQEEIRAGLADIVFEITGIAAEELHLDRSFSTDLEIDSLSLAEVVIAAEDRFGVRISDDYVKELRTIGDAVEFIQRAEAVA